MIDYNLVGPGRAGRSLAMALDGRGWRMAHAFGRLDDQRGAASDVEVVILAVPDDAIAEVAAGVEPGRAALIHLSGAKGLDVLRPHERRGSAHPLMSLPDPVTGATRLTAGAVFAVDGDPMATALVQALDGRPVAVPDERRAVYHATAAIAANHLVALCAQVERLAGEAGVPVDAYWELMTTTLENIRDTSAVSSLTGPASRGDVRTVLAHLDALAPSEHELYITMAREAARLAGRPLPEDRLRP